MPANNGQTPVFMVDALDNDEIWSIGQTEVADIRQKLLLARADVVVLHILNADLSVTPEPSVHPRHANIIGWPEQKSEKILKATKIANEAELHVK